MSLLKKSAATLDAAEEAVTIAGIPVNGAIAVQIVDTTDPGLVEPYVTLDMTVTFEATTDGTNWKAVLMTPSNSGTGASSTTAAGAWSCLTNGYAGFRARCSTYTAGSVSATIRFAGNY